MTANEMIKAFNKMTEEERNDKKIAEEKGDLEKNKYKYSFHIKQLHIVSPKITYYISKIYILYIKKRPVHYFHNEQV